MGNFPIVYIFFYQCIILWINKINHLLYRLDRASNIYQTPLQRCRISICLKEDGRKRDVTGRRIGSIKERWTDGQRVREREGRGEGYIERGKEAEGQGGRSTYLAIPKFILPCNKSCLMFLSLSSSFFNHKLSVFLQYNPLILKYKGEKIKWLVTN